MRFVFTICLLLIQGLFMSASSWAFQPVDHKPVQTNPSRAVELLDDYYLSEEDVTRKAVKASNVPLTDLLDRERADQFLVSYLKANPDFLPEGITANDLYLSYHAVADQSASRSKIIYIQWDQYSNGVHVDQAFVHAAVKYEPAQNQYSLISLKSRLVPPENFIQEPAARLQAQVSVSQAADALNLAADAEVQESKQVLRKRNGVWNAEQEYVFKDVPDKRAVVIGEDVYYKEDRKHLGAPSIYGTVQAKAHPSNVNQMDLETVVLSDIFLQVAGTIVTTNTAGMFIFPSSITSGVLTATLSGLWAAIVDWSQTPVVSFSQNVTAGTSPIEILLNGQRPDELTTAQVDAYYLTTDVHNWLKSIIPSFTGIDTQVTANVNLDPTCNASYWNGSMAFARSSRVFFDNRVYDCPNMVHDDVLAHEYGHFLDESAGGFTAIDGLEDLLAVLYTGDPVIGQGDVAEALGRTANNQYKYPNTGTDLGHYLGQATIGFAWDLRRELKRIYPSGVMEQKLNELLIPVILANSWDIPEYVYDVIVFDDDDAVLSNGTPHLEQILNAALKHNLWPFPYRSVARIDQPFNNRMVDPQSSPVLTITGLADTASTVHGFTGYQLFYGLGVDPEQWTAITPHVPTIVRNGVLGTWDVSALPAGTYTIGLLVTTDNPFIMYQARATVHIDSAPLWQSAGHLKRPDISGSLVAAQGPGQSYLVDVSSGQTTPIPLSNGGDAPRISGNLVVWNNKSFSWGGDNSLFIYDHTLGQTVQFLTHPARQQFPDVSALHNIVVWQDDRNGNWDIYGCIFDLAAQQCSPVQVTNDPSDQLFPTIWLDFLVWQDDRNGNWDIYLMHIPSFSVFQLTLDTADQISPSMDAGKVVYSDNRDGFWNVYMFDLSTLQETPITQTPTASLNPKISGDYIVWQEQEKFASYANASKVMYYDLKTGQAREISNPYDTRNAFPAVDQDRVVFESDINRQAFFPSLFIENLP